MLKNVTAAILLIALFAGNFSKTLIMADYYLHQASYAKDCINKSRPKMHCNGQCQVMKKIKAQEKKEAENKSRIEDLANEVISSKSFFPALPPAPAAIRLSFPRALNQNETRSMTRCCFHPPSGLV